jgi:hypothetical protein
VARFNLEKMAVENPTEDMVYVALYQGISLEEPLMRKLARKQPNSLQGLMDKVEEYIHQEKTLKVMASSRPSQDRSPGRKNKGFRKAIGEDQRQIRKLKDYNFTPLNVEITEVLMEIKRDLEYRRPPRIPGNPPQRNEDKYCGFHEQRGHLIKGCITLRLLIEELIKNGKLVRFLGEQRNQLENSRP